MRCRQAKHRLTELAKSGSPIGEDRDLLEHLKSCPDCALDAEAGSLLDRLLAAGREQKAAGTTPMPVMRQQVEARAAASAGSSRQSMSVPERLRAVWQHRPAVAAGVVAVVVLAMLVSFVPLERDRIVGYEVAFANVQRDLAEDDDRICDVLYTLGLFEADIGHTDCDTTCSVQIIYLKSRQEAHLVIDAFSQLSRADVRADIIPIRSRDTHIQPDRASEAL